MRLVPAALILLAILPAPAGAARKRPVIETQMPGPLPAPRPLSDYPRYDDDLIRIYFDYDSAALSPTAEQIVDLAAQRAMRCHYVAIAIGGHVDLGTPPSRAQRLSRKMAETVRTALIARGLDPKRIMAKGFGASRPAIATEPGAREPFNRRIEMAIRCPD